MNFVLIQDIYFFLGKKINALHWKPNKKYNMKLDKIFVFCQWQVHSCNEISKHNPLVKRLCLVTIRYL